MGDHHDHGHHDHGHHEHSHSRAASAFRRSIVLNSVLTALQLVVGFAFGSLALIGDALHNLGDVVGLVLGWGANQLSRRPIAGPVAWAAAAGIVVNLLSARLFGHDHHHDLNQRAAVLHLLTDAAVSVAVLLSALVVGATGWLWLDALTAIGVGAAVIWSALGLLREALALNLDAAPRHVDLIQVEQALASLPAVLEVEELHVWGLSTSRIALTAHLVIDDERLQREGLSRDQLLALARQRLESFDIRKSTLQLESALESPQAPGTASPAAAHRSSRPATAPAWACPAGQEEGLPGEEMLEVERRQMPLRPGLRWAAEPCPRLLRRRLFLQCRPGPL